MYELGKLMLSSGLLHSSWSKISEIHESRHDQESGLGIKIYRETNRTFVVFVAAATPPQIRGSSNSDSTLLLATEKPNPFCFLFSHKISSFSLLTQALHLFLSAYNNYNNHLNDLKSELLKLLESKKHVVITGAALGGSVASLFTLWLLETIHPKLKRPLCITFGSPFIGDDSLQRILDSSLRNSCFLHVAEAAATTQTPVTSGLKPFGKFLICFDSECICIEDHEAVMELTLGIDTYPIAWRDFGQVLDRLDRSMFTDSRLMIDEVIDRMVEREAKKLRYDQVKKLNDIKISMVYVEWYKRKSKIANIGYYDRYKTQTASPGSQVDMDIERRKKEVNDYWISLVDEVEKKPQSEKSILKTRSLYSSNNYRRMVEPLDIAEYYVSGKKEYISCGRSRHYVMLEKWFKEEGIEPVRCKKRDLSDLLTFDSCFWAKVEEALIVIKKGKTQVVMRDDDDALVGEILKFEEYVWGIIGKREVSPEIFLEGSSFMKWWKMYKEIIRENGFKSSEFTLFMDTRKYKSYGQSKS
ncbi:unnamed protein product [Cochlearia groenlandica]